MKYFTWMPGRQKSGYWKMCLLQLKPYFDVYILQYPPGSHIKPHLDIVKGRNHYRCNIVLHNAVSGGTFICDASDIIQFGSVTIFKPDVNVHSLTEVRKGIRYVLSIGWTTKELTSVDKDRELETLMNRLRKVNLFIDYLYSWRGKIFPSKILEKIIWICDSYAGHLIILRSNISLNPSIKALHLANERAQELIDKYNIDDLLPT